MTQTLVSAIEGALPAGTATIGRVTLALPNPTRAGGKVTAPAAAALIADTGSLAAGSYLIEITAGFSDSVLAGKGLNIEHRNAANAETVAELGHVPAVSCVAFRIERCALTGDERVRVINGAVAGAANSVASASIRAYLLPV